MNIKDKKIFFKFIWSDFCFLLLFSRFFKINVFFKIFFIIFRNFIILKNPGENGKEKKGIWKMDQQDEEYYHQKGSWFVNRRVARWKGRELSSMTDSW